ncbi:MAG: methionine--tRNA ligase subunit beta [Planctomycetota bacterium]|jgi:methionine--tRNA ligase beta chain|nr:methionine--tRNA ligase subunit beta [Planctomycetota bacterium]
MTTTVMFRVECEGSVYRWRLWLSKFEEESNFPPKGCFDENVWYEGNAFENRFVQYSCRVVCCIEVGRFVFSCPVESLIQEDLVSTAISFEEFGKVSLRVATIQAAERVPGTDRLLRLEIDLGESSRQLVAGIGGQYEPDSLLGRQIVVVVNLEPAVIRGVESQGMLLAASDPEGTIALLAPDKPLANGSSVS